MKGRPLHMETDINKQAVKVRSLDAESEIQENLEYWLSLSPEERIEAVEMLRRQLHGNTTGLQRTARVVQRTES